MGELWRNANLKVMLLREIPAMPKVFATVPVSVDDTVMDRKFGEITKNILRVQNQNKESLVALEKSNFRLNLLMDSIVVGKSKGGLIIEENDEKKESIIEEQMEMTPKAVGGSPKQQMEK